LEFDQASREPWKSTAIRPAFQRSIRLNRRVLKCLAASVIFQNPARLFGSLHGDVDFDLYLAINGEGIDRMGDLRAHPARDPITLEKSSDQLGFRIVPGAEDHLGFQQAPFGFRDDCMAF